MECVENQGPAGYPDSPVNTRFVEDEVPDNQAELIEFNAETAKQWPVLTERKDPPVGAEERADKTGKLNCYNEQVQI